jgi:hypothetical protein
MIKLPGTIAQGIIYLGLDGCLTCNYISPLIRMCASQKLFDHLEYSHYQSKELYHEKAKKYLKKYDLSVEGPIPIPLIVITIGESTSIASQTVIEEVACKVQEELTEEELFAFFDEDLAKNGFILSLVSKIISETMY